MPARLSSMELSPPSNPDVDQSARPSRRKSGRVTNKPEQLSPSSGTGSAKRKRATDGLDSDLEQDSASAEGDDESEGEPDEEEMRERRRKARRPSSGEAKGPPKRAKTNGTTTKLAIRTTTGKAKKSNKARQLQDAAADEVGGLYGEHSSDHKGTRHS